MPPRKDTTGADAPNLDTATVAALAGQAGAPGTDAPGVAATDVAAVDPATATRAASTAEGAPKVAAVLEVETARNGAGALDGILSRTTEIPVAIGGPGAGAAQIAERVTETHLTPLVPGADAAGRLPLTGGVDPRYAAHVRAGAPLAGLVPAPRVLGVVDANRVRGKRYATAARPIEHDQAIVGAGRFIPVTFRQFTDLVGIGAVVADDWDDLEDAPEDNAASGN